MILFVKKTGVVGVNILFWGFFVVTSTLLVMGAVILRVVMEPFDPNRRLLQQYSCFWASLYLWFNPFWSLEKKGLENIDPKKTYVMVSNHQSMADILILFNTFLHFKWVSKKSLFRVPLLGWNMRLNGYIPIERGSGESREKMSQSCRNWIRKGSSILFFPEGTRSEDGALLPFKKGAFRLALETGCDVLPIVISGSLHAIPKHSVFLHGQSKMSLKILPPVSIEVFQREGLDLGIDHLAGVVREKMAELINHLS